MFSFLKTDIRALVVLKFCHPVAKLYDSQENYGAMCVCKKDDVLF